MKELRIYREKDNLLISGVQLYNSFEDFVNYLIFKITNENEIIRKKFETEYIYSIELDENLNKFIIVFNGEKYFISFDDEEIRKFKLEKYDDITFELKRLIVAFEKRKELEDKKYVIEKQEIEEKFKKEKEYKIIEDGKKGIFIDEDAKKLFLELLKKKQNAKDSILLDLRESFFGWKECKEKLVDVYVERFIRHVPPNEFNGGGYITRREKLGQKLEVNEFYYSPFKVFRFFAIVLVALYLCSMGEYPLFDLCIGISIDAIVTSTWAISHFISTRIQKRKEKINNKVLIEELEYELNLNKETKSNNISKEMIEKSIDSVANKLNNISNKDKIIILEKLKRVLELSSLNEDNAMMRLNVIKQNLNYFEQRENNTYMADKPKRKVLKPNINNITRKTFTRG